MPALSQSIHSRAIKFAHLWVHRLIEQGKQHGTHSTLPWQDWCVRAGASPLRAHRTASTLSSHQAARPALPKGSKRGEKSHRGGRSAGGHQATSGPAAPFCTSPSSNWTQDALSLLKQTPFCHRVAANRPLGRFSVPRPQKNRHPVAITLLLPGVPAASCSRAGSPPEPGTSLMNFWPDMKSPQEC